ncbi:hypothetical protein [Streptomyces sp. ICC4]|uniref:hypothetical protein n=1 Tax=Streptomyces sp. ICC4 TaxID=2099584 RepID=UPI001955065D|nr:hypothetical protein [Streptomyces sp. ICC4]
MPAKQLAQGLNCTVADIEAYGGKPLDALLEQVPDEFDQWVRSVIEGLEERAALRDRPLNEAHAALAPPAAAGPRPRLTTRPYAASSGLACRCSQARYGGVRSAASR